jgi:hypothetical protein
VSSCRSETPFINIPVHFSVMAAHNCSSATQCAPALIIVPCGLNYTSITPLWSQNTVVISVPVDFMALNVFSHGDPGFFPLYGRKLYLKGMVMDPHLISSDYAVEKFMAVNSILLPDWSALAILCTFWSSCSAHSCHCTHVWQNPNPRSST